MENQLNNIGNHGGRLAVRFARLGQSGDAYQQAYLVLAKYMIDLTNATIDYASLPTAYQKEASQCFNTIKEVEGTYAQTLGNDLKRVPQQMMNDFMAMALLLTPAIEAAERLAGGSDCDDDVKAVNDFIKKAIRFAEDGITNCGYVIKNVDAFTKGNGKEAYLKVIEDNATRLVQIMADSTKDYEQQVAAVKALIDELNGEIRNLSNAQLGTSLGVGVFLALAAFSIGAMIVGGAGAGLTLTAIGVTSIAVGAGATAIFSCSRRIKAIQEEIEKQSQQIDTLNAAILQFDLMSDQFSQMVTSLDDVRSALLVIQDSWSGLNDELTEMQTEVKQINRDKNKEQWQTVADELRATATVLSEVQEHIKRLNEADLKVSVGAYNFDMSDDQLAAAYAEYNQVEFIEYLRTA